MILIKFERNGLQTHIGVSFVNLMTFLVIYPDYFDGFALKQIIQTVGKDIKLPCMFLNDTYPNNYNELEWYKNDYKLDKPKNNSRKKYRKDGKVLKIKESSQSDSGVYRCIGKYSNISDINVITYNISIKQPIHKPPLKF